MSFEPFGTNERNWTQDEKNIIAKFLKYDNHVPLKISEMVYSAEVESEYFRRLGYVAGGVTYAIFFFFPIIRNTPLIRRSLLAAIPAAYTMTWGFNTHEEMKWLKTHAAWQKFIVYHGQHSKIFV